MALSGGGVAGSSNASGVERGAGFYAVQDVCDPELQVSDAR